MSEGGREGEKHVVMTLLVYLRNANTLHLRDTALWIRSTGPQVDIIDWKWQTGGEAEIYVENSDQKIFLRLATLKTKNGRPNVLIQLTESSNLMNSY